MAFFFMNGEYSSIEIGLFKKILRKEIVFLRKGYFSRWIFFLIDVGWFVDVEIVHEYS